MVLLLSPGLPAARGSAANTPDRSDDGSQGAKWNSGRPRLFFTPDKIDRLKQRIERDDQSRQAWLQIKQRADRQLKEELVSKEYAEGGAGQHGNYGRPSGQVAGMASTLGLVYRMTGDEQYARKLKEALLHYGGLARWAGDAGNIPPWHSELNTATFCFGYAIGYDSIYDFLSDAERTSIAKSMVQLGILPTLNDWVLPGERIHALDSMGHNWWSVCVSMAGLAAISLLGDEPRAERWVQEVSDAFPQWFYYQGNVLQNKSLNFDRNGAFYESVNYANYALSEYLLFRLAYTNVFRDTKPAEMPILRTVGDFFVATCYPTDRAMLSVNFGDGSLRTTGSQTLRLLLANRYDAEAYHCTWAERTGDSTTRLGWFTTKGVPCRSLRAACNDPCSILISGGHCSGPRGRTMRRCWRSSPASPGTTPIRMQAHSSCSTRANRCSSIPAIAPTAGRSIPVTIARARPTTSSWWTARPRIPKIAVAATGAW
jgi:hypothetical protein